MKLTPKTIFGKLRRKLGFTDAKPEKSKDDEIVIFGFTRRELNEFCAQEGITLDELLEKVARHERERAAMPPGERPIVIM